MSSVRDVVILGATGSVGTQALDIARRNRDRFNVVGLSASGNDPRALAAAALEFGVKTVAVAQGTAVEDLTLQLYAEAQRQGWRSGQFKLPKILGGPDSTAELAGAPCDVVLNAVTGSVGLAATMQTLAAGTTLALANKESLIAGGRLVTRAAAEGQLVPVDSEHSAIAQCLRSGTAAEVSRLILTASGGPFRGRAQADLHDVTVQEAMAHPTWSMGTYITINSATLVNKGLELIEAHLLFDVPADRIDVAVHPQSIVHSMVEFVDGSTIAQASPPDMRLPIALALGWPDRIAGAASGLDWTTAQSWTFESVDDEAFPAIRLAREAARIGGLAPAVYNAANEEALAAFLDGRIGFLQIVQTVEQIMTSATEKADLSIDATSLADVSDLEAWIRPLTRELIDKAVARA